MAAARGTSTKMKNNWDDDTIYSESLCQPEDVLYEGSEDDDYESPATRRRRYEEAGQRFLQGTVPLLFSATLKGPFDSRTGFTNPWISNRHKAAARLCSQPARAPAVALTESKGLATSKPNPQTRTTSCHLPSPESLKQAPYTQQHQYLDATEFDKVNAWREQVSCPPNRRDIYQDKTESPTSVKRRASGSEWLKTVPAKRQRSAIIQKLSRRNQLNDDELDDLLAEMPSSRFGNAAQMSSPTKRRSPRSALRKTSAKKMVESDDELSPHKAAAATLSSPVSLKKAPIATFALRNQPSNYLTSSIGTQTTPSRLRYVDVLDTLTNQVMPQQKERSDHEDDVEMSGADESMQETCSSTQSGSDTILNEDHTTTKATCDGETTRITNNDSEQECPKLEPKLEKEFDLVDVDANSQYTTDEAAVDVQMEDLLPQGVALESVQDLMQPCTQSDLYTDTEEEQGKTDGSLITQSLGGGSLAIEQPLKGHGASRNHAGTTSGTAAMNRETCFDENNACETAALNDNTQANPESCGRAAPSTPPRASIVQDTSDFNLRNIFNRFVPSSPWSKLASLTKTASPSPGTQSARECADLPILTDQVSMVDAKFSCSLLPTTPVDVASNSEKHSISTPKISVNCSLSEPQSDEAVGHEDLHELAKPESTLSSSNGARPTQDSAKNDIALPESQQSPWAKTEQAVLTRSPLGIISPNHSVPKSLGMEAREHAAILHTPEIQSPFAQETSPAIAAFASQEIPSDENSESTTFAKPILPRPSTPEPQFCIKSFSSFLSPSPGRKHRKGISASFSGSRVKNAQDSLPSTWNARRNLHRRGLRVSWAANLVEFEGASCEETFAASRHPSTRQSSPPPETPINRVEASCDTRFAKHFEAVANRAKGRQRGFIPTESQQMQSPAHVAMAKTFIVADTRDQKAQGKDGEINHAESLPCCRESEEPMDDVEDVFREMGDFLDTWNLDAELESARKGAETGAISAVEP